MTTNWVDLERKEQRANLHPLPCHHAKRCVMKAMAKSAHQKKASGSPADTSKKAWPAKGLVSNPNPNYLGVSLAKLWPPKPDASHRQALIIAHGCAGWVEYSNNTLAQEPA